MKLNGPFYLTPEQMEKYLAQKHCASKRENCYYRHEKTQPSYVRAWVCGCDCHGK